MSTAADGQRRRLHGDNTDWQAIYEAASDNLSSATDLVGLVIGAGGTCRAAIYALHKLGARSILLFNRTRENAVNSGRIVPGRIQHCSRRLAEQALPHQPAVIVSTVPGDSLTTDTALTLRRSTSTRLPCSAPLSVLAAS